jgi:hypothetical protein
MVVRYGIDEKAGIEWNDSPAHHNGHQRNRRQQQQLKSDDAFVLTGAQQTEY